MLIDDAYARRVRGAMFGALLRANLLTLGLFALLALGAVGLALVDGDFTIAVFGVAMVSLAPLFLWRTASRSTLRTQLGTYVAYAVTPDGTLHVSTVAGTSTINPGFVSRVLPARDCLLLALFNGVLMVVPRELLPDADAALLARARP